MKISVLLAVYNGEKYLEKSLNSVLGQTYKEMEVLIGFNGTVDKSREIVSRYSDSRIRVFDYKDDKGKAKTLNKLLKVSEGDWIAIQDDDDIWMDRKLEKQVRFCNAFDVIGTQISYINESGEASGSVTLETTHALIKEKSMKGDNQVANTSAIVRKKCLESVGGWSEDLDGIEDFDLWLRLMKEGYKFINLDTTEVWHRVHPKSNFNTRQYDLSRILPPAKVSWSRKLKRILGLSKK